MIRSSAAIHAHLAAGRYDEAIPQLGRAVALDPGDANAQVALAIAALRDKAPAAAQGPLEKAVLLQPRIRSPCAPSGSSA